MKSIISFLLFAKQAFSSKVHWDYDHMSAWSDDYPMCATSDQSPRDIQSTEALIDANVCTANFEWDIDFTKQTWKVANNGHSIVLHPVEELTEERGDDDEVDYLALTLNENTIAKFPNYFATTDDHQTYCLDGVHFHWGTLDNGKTGSEHLVDGERFPLEAHFVHYSCDHNSVGTTLGEFPEGDDVSNGKLNGVDVHQLGVVGIFYDIVEDRINPAFEAIFSDNRTFQNIMYPPHDGEAHETQFVYGFDISQLIPDHVTTQGYYAYKGSLTTPPCTNIVNWHLMNARGYIGRSQIEKFRELMSANDTYTIAPNYREAQDNINQVYSCIDVNTVTSVETIIDYETSWIAIAAVISFIIGMTIVGAFMYFKHQKTKQHLIDEINRANKRTHLASISGGSDMTNQYGQTNV